MEVGVQDRKEKSRLRDIIGHPLTNAFNSGLFACLSLYSVEHKWYVPSVLFAAGAAYLMKEARSSYRNRVTFE